VRGASGGEGGVPAAGQRVAGVAGGAGGARGADGGADGAGGPRLVRAGHDGAGLHQPAGDRGAGAAHLRAAARDVRASDAGAVGGRRGAGVLDAWMWARRPKGEADLVESLRWTEGYEQVAEVAARLPGTRLVYMGDREAGLRELIDQAAEAGHLELARRGGQTREVTAILAREESPPEGEKPVEWLLLTNEPVGTLDEACLRVAWYRRRWLAEIFFRILKSGCQVESLQLATRERLERALAVYLVVAWRILHLVTRGRGGAAARSCRATWPSRPRSGGPPGRSPSASRRPRPRRRWARWSAAWRLRRLPGPQGRRTPRPQGALGGPAEAHGLRRGVPGRS